jgi:hypothetical protein
MEAPQKTKTRTKLARFRKTMLSLICRRQIQFKYKHDQMHVSKSGTVRGDWGRGKEEENGREWIILKYITSVYEDDDEMH